MKRLAILLGALGVLTAPAAYAASLTPHDHALLMTLARTMEQASSYDGTIWPGFQLHNQPLVIHDKGRLTLLVNYPKPPMGFSLLPSLPPILKGRVAAYWGAVPQLNRTMDVTVRFCEKRATFIPYQYFNFGKLDVESILTPAFAAYSQQHFQVEKELDDLPTEPSAETPETLALASLEDRILAASLHIRNLNELMGYGRYFMAVRQARLHELPPSSARFEELQETMEGTMRYAVARYTEAPWIRRSPWRSIWLDLPGLDKELSQPLDNGESQQSHLSASGAAIGQLLDRLRTVHWKEAVMSGETLTDLFSHAVYFREPEAPSLLRTAKARFGFKVLLNQVMRAQPSAYRAFLGRTGPCWRITGLPPIVSTPATSSQWLRITSPSAPQAIDSQTLFLGQLERLDYRHGKTSMLIDDLPIVCKSAATTWPFQNLTFYPSTSTPQLELDGKPFTLQDGSFPFQHLHIEGAHLKLSFSTGTLVIQGKNLTIHLHS